MLFVTWSRPSKGPILLLEYELPYGNNVSSIRVFVLKT